MTTEDNRRHWRMADGLSAAAANSPGVRRVLRSRSRYEYDNGPYCNGIIRTRADDLVGTGPTLQILTEDDKLNELIETGFAAWMIATKFAEKLHTMDQTRCRDGEAFALLVTNKQLAHRIKLDVKLIEAELVSDPAGIEFPAEGKLDGVEYDDLGYPIAYHVLREHPGDILVNLPIAADRIEARFVLHWFRVDRPQQLRGVPELTSALPIFPYMRRWVLATLAAAEYAASQAGVLETDAPVDPNDTVSSPFKAIEFDRAMFTELPAGYKLKQITAEHPNQTFGDFKRENCNEAGRPVRMPSNVVSADSSKHNFSSAKLDHFGYRGALKVDRYFCGLNILDRAFAEYVREGNLIAYFPEGVDVLALPRKWLWPGWPSMDKDQAGQDIELLGAGLLTLAEYHGADGKDWRKVVIQRGREIKFCEAQGVPTVPPAAPPAQPKPEPTDGGTDGEESQPQPAGANRLARGALNGPSGNGRHA